MEDSSLATFRARLRQGVTPALCAELEKFLRGRYETVGSYTAWGLLCEEAGLFNLAFREFQLALRDRPDAETAALRLAQHYRERGDPSRALELLSRLVQQQPAREEVLGPLLDLLVAEGSLPRARQTLQQAVAAGLAPAQAAALRARLTPQAEEEPPGDEELAPRDADAARFQTLFAGREDLHARQWARQGGEAGYSPVHEPFTTAVARNHLLGSYTVGIYPIRLDGTCTFFAVDLDIDRAALEQAHGQPAQARQLRDLLRAESLRLLAVLRDLGFAPLFEDSGYKGRHYWVFLEQPESAEVVHLLGRLFLAGQSGQVPRGLHLEFFPKQASVQGKGLGNLIKLPLGIHRRSGRRAVFLDEHGRPEAQPFELLRQVQRLPRERLFACIELLKGGTPATALTRTAATAVRAETTGKPPTPDAPPTWTEADFASDPRMRHLLQSCPVLAALKRNVDEHQRLNHEEQLVLIHTLGHVEGGPQAINYLLQKCVDVGPEKLLKGQLRGNPVSCASIRKKIGHVTRRVACNCPFEFAPDRYPTPVLHLLGLPSGERLPPPPERIPADLEALARRFSAITQRRQDIVREYDELRAALLEVLRRLPERQLPYSGGRYCLIEEAGEEVIRWEAVADVPALPGPAAPVENG